MSPQKYSANFSNIYIYIYMSEELYYCLSIQPNQNVIDGFDYDEIVQIIDDINEKNATFILCEKA